MTTASAHAITLAIDASTYVGSVAVWRGTTRIAEGEALMRGVDEERLMPAVIATLAEGGTALREVSRVVCGAGPGSFTSLRIAAAIAKGIVTGTQGRATLHAVSSLSLIVGARAERLAPDRYLALLDAMRGERYAALIRVVADGTVVVDEALGRIPVADVSAACERLGAHPIGPEEMIEQKPHARGALAAAGNWEALPTLALDGWEPDYGRLAEAQVKWESTHGRPLPATGP
jgi:tRNA threonylcarbamoyladenosine biosynthesis protein TsaB